MSKVYENNLEFDHFKYGKISKMEDKYFIPMYEEIDGSQKQILLQLKKVYTLNTLNDEGKLRSCIEFVLDEQQKENIGEIEDAVLNVAKEYKKEWFPDKDLSDSYFDNAFMQSFKPIKKSKGYKFQVKTTKNVSIFDSSHNTVEHCDVKENQKVSIIIQLYGIWFAKSRFGLTWRLHQVKIHDIPKPPQECLFADTDEQNDELENVFPDV